MLRYFPLNLCTLLYEGCFFVFYNMFLKGEIAMKEYNTKLLKIIISTITSLITAIITVIFSSPIAYENGQRNGVIEGKEIQQQNNQIQLQEIFGDIININGSNNKIDTNDLKNISNSYVNYEAECSNLQSQLQIYKIKSINKTQKKK